MKNQQGAALIVVLSMLTASLMLGLTSMQSSMIDERLAGNYKAAAQAQMAAEHMGAWIVQEGFPDTEEWQMPDELKGSQPSEQFFLERSYRHCREADDCQDTSNSFVARGRVLQSEGGVNVIAEHLLEVGEKPDEEVEGPYDYPTNLTSTLLCIGADCPSGGSGLGDYFFGSGNLPDNFACQGSHCRPGSGNRGEKDSDDYFGSVYQKEGSEDRLSDWEEFVDSLSGEVMGSGSLSQGGSVNPNVIVIDGGEVSSTGNINSSGIIVVRRGGGEFNASGTGSHEGLIIVEGSKGTEGEEGYEEAGQVALGKNFSLYGSLVVFNGTDNIDFSSATPNGGARYNASALSGLPKGDGGIIWSSL